MDELTPKAKWTVTQPWRGLFGTALTLWVAFAIAAAFDMQSFMGNFTLFMMSFVAIEVVMGLGWGRQSSFRRGLAAADGPDSS